MKYKDYKFKTASESMDLTYKQACMYFEENLDMIENSKFDLFNDDEELSFEDAGVKYNEINRRLQTFGQAFELFMKYIIHASRIEKNPNITTDQLWNKWIRGHRMVALINDKANSSEVLPNFKEVFNSTLNSYYGIYGVEYIRYLVANALHGIINPYEILNVLQPQNYKNKGSITDEEVEKIIEKNTAIYEKCRYNIQQMTHYNFGEVFYFISFIKFFAKMVYISNNKTNIDYNVAYVHAMVDDPVIKCLLNSFRTKKEIKEILNDDLFNKDAKLLSYLLAVNKRPIKDIKDIVGKNKQLEDPKNLYTFLNYNISDSDINKCNEKGLNVMLLVSDFTFEQISKLINIPKVGEYLKENPLLVNKMITQNKSDFGLTFEYWYKLLNSVEIKEHPEYLKNIIEKYTEVYNSITKNELCNRIFASPNKIEKEKKIINNSSGDVFSKKFSDMLLSNISNNTKLFNEIGMNVSNIALSLDSDNVKEVLLILAENNVNLASSTVLFYPANEVLAVVNYMKKKNYNFSSEDFQKDFWEEYNKHSEYNYILKERYILDEFLEENGLIRISDTRYCKDIMEGYADYVIANHDNPLPNLKK